MHHFNLQCCQAFALTISRPYYKHHLIFANALRAHLVGVGGDKQTGSRMNSLVNKIKVLATKYPMVRGMISYSLIWPTSSIIQQTIEGKSWGTYDWWRCLRFSLYGGFFVAPTLYGWVKISTAMWPQTSLRTGLIKAAVEQISYTPAAMTCFFFFMSLLEMKTVREAATEVGNKFLPTYKVALCVWPVLATINFSLIPERNRVPFISMCSLMWTIFLAYMKHLEHRSEDQTGKPISL